MTNENQDRACDFGKLPDAGLCPRCRQASWDGLRQPVVNSLTPLGKERAISETDATFFSLGVVVEQRDHQTAGHCARLAFISVAMGMTMKLESEELLSLYQGGYLHDVGKIGIPDAILFKPGRLDDEEWKIMQSHPARGEEICQLMSSLAGALPLIRHHHERLDGTGYPDGLRGSEIPLLARVLQIADIYDALTNPRPYKEAYSAEKALRTIEEEAAKGWRDAEIVNLFLRTHNPVIARAKEFTAGSDHNLEAIRNALARLH